MQASYFRQWKNNSWELTVNDVDVELWEMKIESGRSGLKGQLI